MVLLGGLCPGALEAGSAKSPPPGNGVWTPERWHCHVEKVSGCDVGWAAHSPTHRPFRPPVGPSALLLCSRRAHRLGGRSQGLEHSPGRFSHPRPHSAPGTMHCLQGPSGWAAPPSCLPQPGQRPSLIPILVLAHTAFGEGDPPLDCDVVLFCARGVFEAPLLQDTSAVCQAALASAVFYFCLPSSSVGWQL